MRIRERYMLTGGGLIIGLVFLVTLVRSARGVSSFSNGDNLKVRGPKGAPIHLVVYSDFQCPACKNVLEPIEELRGQFSNAIEVEFRHYPLERAHRWAVMAASFAECAAEQGKFWEFHDRLFLEQETWSHAQEAPSFLARYALELNLDRKKLEACLENPKTARRIRRERSRGAKQGIQSTPTIFINGHRLVGSSQLKERGRAIVFEELDRSSGKAHHER